MLRTLLATAAAVGALLLASASAYAQAPATQTLTFKEVDQGSTFAFVDNPPRAPHRHGAPTHVSAGDLSSSRTGLSTAPASRSAASARCAS